MQNDGSDEAATGAGGGSAEAVAQMTPATEDAARACGKSDSDTWYPPLDKTLMCLAKIYRCLDMKIFEGLAREALLACTERLNHGASEILRRAAGHGGSGGAGGANAKIATTTASLRLNANLFLIKHILVLREQIAPFEIDFTSTETSLDFSKTTDALSNFVTSGARLSVFTDLSLQNPLLELVTMSVPAVVRSKTNAKLVLEEQLKQACESFILNTTNAAAGPLVELLRSIAKADDAAYKRGDLGDAAPTLIVSADDVGAALRDVRARAELELPAVASLLSLYLRNPATEEVLLKPVRASIRECISRLRGSVLLRLAGEERTALQGDLDLMDETLRKLPTRL